jgi:hypothetical protein
MPLRRRPVIDWLPDNEDDLGKLLDQGLLTERHTLDFKRELEPGKGANKELARDLAQLAIDRGVLVIGVDDNDKTLPPQMTPVQLDGLKERIDQVARSLIDQPLHVRIQIIAAAGQPGRGCLLVVVPPSPSAPHQVDGRYYGRGDTTRHVLSDAEVQRLHQLALRRQHDAEQLLDLEVARAPGLPSARQHAHLIGVAQPVTGRPDLLHRVLGSQPQAWHQFLHGLRGGPAGRPFTNPWSPDLPGASEVTRRARGWALSSVRMPGRQVEPAAPGFDIEKRVLDVEVYEDGGVRLFCGRASDAIPTASGEQPVESVIDVLIMGLTKRLVLVTKVVADTANYLGSWDLGVAVTRLRGLQSYTLLRAGQEWAAPPFSEDDYRQTVRVTYERLTGDPDAVVEDLTGQLNRALGGAVKVPGDQPGPARG